MNKRHKLFFGNSHTHSHTDTLKSMKWSTNWQLIKMRSTFVNRI